VSETVLADYMPESNESYRLARSLGYEVALKSHAIADAMTIVIFAFVGFVVTGVLMGLKFDRVALQRDDLIFLTLIPIFVIGFLLWRLFRIWCMAPSMSEAAPGRFCMSENGESLIIEVGLSRIVTPFDRIHYYLERSEYFVFQLGQFTTAIIIPKRAFCECAIDQFRQILLDHGVKANWWTCGKLLG
jgi:hypothetical protein